MLFSQPNFTYHYPFELVSHPLYEVYRDTDWDMPKAKILDNRNDRFTAILDANFISSHCTVRFQAWNVGMLEMFDLKTCEIVGNEWSKYLLDAVSKSSTHALNLTEFTKYGDVDSAKSYNCKCSRVSIQHNQVDPTRIWTRWERLYY